MLEEGRAQVAPQEAEESMRKDEGFSLIELLIVVAIILIIAAIAIPSLMRARISANESGMVGDIRTLLSAEATFQSASGGYGDLSCLAPNPQACALGAGTNPLIDSVMANTTLVKSGFDRSFATDAVVVNSAVVIAGVWNAFCYGGVPANIGRTGNRGFAGDSTGIVVYSTDGSTCVGAGSNVVTCVPLGN